VWRCQLKNLLSFSSKPFYLISFHFLTYIYLRYQVVEDKSITTPTTKICLVLPLSINITREKWSSLFFCPSYIFTFYINHVSWYLLQTHKKHFSKIASSKTNMHLVAECWNNTFYSIYQSQMNKQLFGLNGSLSAYNCRGSNYFFTCNFDVDKHLTVKICKLDCWCTTFLVYSTCNLFENPTLNLCYN
jgi:hypothetical protein